MIPPYESYRETGLGWLPKAPAHWAVVPFRSCASIVEGQVQPSDDKYNLYLLIAPNHIDSGSGRLSRYETAAEQGAISGKYLVKAGDIVYSKIRPVLNKVCIADRDCLCSADMYPIRVRNGVYPRLLLYLILSSPFVNLMAAESMRVAMPKVNRETFAALRLVIPAFEEQMLIAAFLEREMCEADALVAKYERLIELLEEKRVALVTQAVTKGLDPNAQMKDSGIRSIGQVPSHWAVLSLRRMATVRGGTAVSEEHLTDDETAIPFFKVGDIESADEHGVMRDARAFVAMRAATSTPGTEFPKGTVVLAKRGAALLMNRFRQTGNHAFLDSNLMGLNLNETIVHVRFALHVLSTVDFAKLVKPGAIPSIDAPEIKDLVIALPPMQEQAQILHYVESWTRTVSAELALVRRAVGLVKERRSALITAAVTGQIDVTNYRSRKRPAEVPS